MDTFAEADVKLKINMSVCTSSRESTDLKEAKLIGRVWRPDDEGGETADVGVMTGDGDGSRYQLRGRQIDRQ